MLNIISCTVFSVKLNIISFIVAIFIIIINVYILSDIYCAIILFCVYNNLHTFEYLQNVVNKFPYYSLDYS